ncbi:hypothetical protein [Erythrobacter oryzae]|uniref:hypothetical protein n=1 Tax=Erythrobacter oryzae TaxID=3019556 RepID=UPI002557B02F|nr:hypothetical protein [Erythrobacter sp. COR-2]
MGHAATIIRMRWWGHLLLLVCLPVFTGLAAAMGFAGLDLLNEAGGWWKGPLMLASAGLMLFVVMLLLNGLLTYRLEVDPSGLRLIGNFWTISLRWSEITAIRRRINLRGIGYHVHIEVDGSNLPRRHWSGLWSLGYMIPTAMEKGPRELAAYLKRKRSEALKREGSPA